MAARKAPPAAPARDVPPAQLELFPERVVIERLDPRAVLGPRTRVAGLFTVRIGEAGAWHRVFSDRHGVYCEEHGPECRAVAEVRKATAPARLRTGDLFEPGS